MSYIRFTRFSSSFKKILILFRMKTCNTQGNTTVKVCNVNLIAPTINGCRIIKKTDNNAIKTHQVVKNHQCSNAQLSKPKVHPVILKKEDPQTRFIREALDSHNRYRARHGCRPLVHSQELSNIAQKYAQLLANKIGGLIHSGNRYKGKALGENLAFSYDSALNFYPGQKASKQFYEEIVDHDFNGDYQPETGHFTQLVWRESTQVGFGVAEDSDGGFYAVANYYPAGNVIGRFTRNVPRPLK